MQTESPEREIYHDPDVVRAEDFIDDSVIAKTTHTASKMLSKFRQMEENLSKEPEPVGKPCKFVSIVAENLSSCDFKKKSIENIFFFFYLFIT